MSDSIQSRFSALVPLESIWSSLESVTSAVPSDRLRFFCSGHLDSPVLTEYMTLPVQSRPCVAEKSLFALVASVKLGR